MVQGPQLQVCKLYIFSRVYFCSRITFKTPFSRNLLIPKGGTGFASVNSE